MIVIQIVICIILYSVCGQVDSYTQVRVVGREYPKILKGTQKSIGLRKVQTTNLISLRLDVFSRCLVQKVCHPVYKGPKFDDVINEQPH